MEKGLRRVKFYAKLVPSQETTELIKFVRDKLATKLQMWREFINLTLLTSKSSPF